MFQHYLKITGRSLAKNKMATVINILGLTIGLTAGILVILMIKDDVGYDRFHKNLDNIHVVMVNSRQVGKLITGSSTPGPLAAAMDSRVPEVKYAARVGGTGQHLLSHGTTAIYENTACADPDLLNIMKFPAIQGNPVTALKDPGNIVLTAATAKKLFGNADAMGKIIRHNDQRDLKVAAIIADLPRNSSIQFNAIVPFSQLESANRSMFNSWDNYVVTTYTELQPGVQPAALRDKLNALYPFKIEDKSTGFFVYPYREWHLHNGFKNGKPSGGRIEMIYVMMAIGILVILIACINFMNLSTARSVTRSREVGVRKTLGASRKQVIIQYLGEAVIMTSIAFIIAIVLAAILLPSLNTLSGKEYAINIADWQMWLSLAALTLLTGLIAGSYPAFFMSAFQPVKVLKGVIANKRSGALLRKGLVTFQFVISIFLIVATIVIFKQHDYIQRRPIGYDMNYLIDIPARGEMGNRFNVVKADLMQIPGVVSVSAGNDNLVRFGGATDGLQWPGKTADQNFPVQISNVENDWATTAGMKIVEGRDFNAAFGTDTTGALINQSAVKRMGLKAPVVGTKLGDKTIIGVFEDFSYNDAFAMAKPLVVFHTTGGMGHFFVRLENDGDWKQRLSKIEQVLKRHNPGYPFEFHFTKDIYQQQFKGITSTGQVISITGSIAIFISCMGLFGLSAFLAERRNKEIGIRKVFGANVTRIWMMLSQDFLKPVLIAFAIATPLSALAMIELLSSFDYRIALSWWIFAIAGAMALIIALATVSYQGIKAAMTNPVESLRAE